MRPGRDDIWAAALLLLPGLALLAAQGLPAPGPLLLAALGLLMLRRPLQAGSGRGPALATLVLLLYGTTLSRGVLLSPSLHAGGAVLLAALVVRDHLESFGTGRRGLALAAAGLATLLGPAHAGLLALNAPRPRRRWGTPVLLLLLIGTGVVTGWLGGRVPGRPRGDEALFSSAEGVLFLSPVLWLALAGSLARRRETLPALAVSAVVLAVFAGHDAGDPVARGPAAGLVVLLAPGLAASLELLRGWVQRRPLGALAAATLPLCLWNLLFMEQSRRLMIPRDDTVSFVAVTGNNARLLADLAGAPLAWPANWLFAWRYDVPVSRFETLVARRLSPGGTGLGALAVGGDVRIEESLLLEGWSARRECGETDCRGVKGRARALLPVARADAARLLVEARGQGELDLRLNGTALGRWPLPEELVTLQALLPAGLLRTGPNELVFETDPGGAAEVALVRLERP